jgi:hypothetical protein
MHPPQNTRDARIDNNKHSTQSLGQMMAASLANRNVLWLLDPNRWANQRQQAHDSLDNIEATRRIVAGYPYAHEKACLAQRDDQPQPNRNQRYGDLQSAEFKRRRSQRRLIGLKQNDSY